MMKANLMPIFELIPASVEAYQWMVNGDHPHDNSVDGSEGKVVRHFQSSGQARDAAHSRSVTCSTCKLTYDLHGWIDTPMSAGYKVCPGDYIVADEVMGWKPMPPKQFLSTYQEVLS